MEASQRPRTRTESECISETAQATHAFKISRYSQLKHLKPGVSINSATFTVGGYDWCICYHPAGSRSQESKVDHVSVFLKLCTKDSEVRAMYDFRLVNQATGLSSSRFSKGALLKSHASENPTWGTRKFMTISELETSPYLKDDRLVIECDVTVILGDPAVESKTLLCDIPVPPSNLSDNLRKLLEAGERMDVAFEVQGENFRAHRIVLAMRSPVFEAELYGPVGENNRQCITIEDMQPAIFKALLHFIYTYSLPGMDNLGEDENQDMIKHLLVAADRYGMERMKVMCESILARRLAVDGVADTLALAVQYHCNKLKDACIEFINSSTRVADVLTSRGYPRLKRAHPSVIVEIWERAAMTQKI